LVWGVFKIVFAIIGFIIADTMAQLLINSLSIQSLLDAKSVHSKMAIYMRLFFLMIGICGVLSSISAVLMIKEKFLGFYILALTNTFLASFFIYWGLNVYPKFEYIALIPFLFLILYGVFVKNIFITYAHSDR
jgi:hypothetical protein